MPRIPVEPGVSLYVEDTGGEGRPVVFLHGWPLDLRQWEYQVAALQPEGFRCVAVDARGFGDSDRAWGHYSYDVFADDLKVVFGALELRGAALVGLSLGAGTALRYMSRHAGAGVTQVVLCGAPGRWDKSAIDGLTVLDRPSLVRRVGVLLFPDAEDGGGLTRQWFYEMAFAAMPYATSRCLEILRDTDVNEDVDALTASTLILHGRDDGLSPERVAAALHEAVPDSRLVLLEQAGHGAFFTQRHRFNAELARFLSPSRVTSHA
jgi:non-heme chloroperoxidase